MHSKFIYTIISNKNSIEESAYNLSDKIVISGEEKPLRIIKEADFHLRKIKKYYLSISSKNNGKSFTQKQNWITDNYYLIENELKYSLITTDKNKKLPCAKYSNSIKIPAIFSFACLLCEYESYELNEDNIEIFLKSSQKKRFFQIRELEAFTHILKFVICKKIYDIINAKADTDIHILGNCIKGLRFLSTYNSNEFISKVYEPERIIYSLKDKTFNDLTPETKDLYRKKLEESANKLNITEEEAIKDILNKSSAKKEGPVHFGTLLFAKKKNIMPIYYLILTGYSIIFSMIFAYSTKSIFTFLLLFFPIFEVLKQILDFLFSKSSKIEAIPALSLKKGIPDNAKTGVVVSTLLISVKDVKKLSNRLADLYHTNYENNISFIVLADFCDSKTRVNKNDDDIKKEFFKVIEELNAEYGNYFYGFIRRRKYNERHGRYMGWERKRGAIVELVNYIKNKNTSFDVIIGDADEIKKIKYILALDADTFVPIGEVKRLCGMMLHPVNKPFYNRKRNIISSGYALIAPKIINNLESSDKSKFARIFAGLGGTEVYNNPSFELNQILSDEGIFTGKGMFDVDLFEKTLCARFPENTILSHDLLEGAVLRTGYTGEVTLIDSFPHGILSYYKRLHRWIRGDVQASVFLLRRVRNAHNKKQRNLLPLSSKIKITENLRRAINPIIIIALLIKAIFTPQSMPLYLALSFLCLGTGELLNILNIIYSTGLNSIKIRYTTKNSINIVRLFKLIILKFILLPYSAYISLDAVITSLWRLIVSKNNLLDWVTADQTDKRFKGSITEYFINMPICAMVGVLFFYNISIINTIIGILFIISPVISFYLSREINQQNVDLNEEQRDKLISQFSDMWRYMTDFLQEKTNYLPPDNYQETPLGITADRTSPTNIGLCMLCVVSAHDFKLISSSQMIDYLTKITDTVFKMEKFNGHLYNWYDNATLSLLEPKYVSSVDSGNFIACLITLKQALLELDSENNNVHELIDRIKFLIDNTDFDCCYDENKALLKIGFEPGNTSINENYYDLLMSEARITSYYLTAKRAVPVKHFRALGRLAVSHKGYFGLKSWTGTMFEYFMPYIFLENYNGSMLNESLEFAYRMHKNRSKKTDTPYGISESGFYGFDNSLNYQYKAFGVAKLGLKKGLDTELVVSPYSTYLTLPFKPVFSIKNLNRMENMGAYGKYGFYEAIDFTRTRVSGKNAIVKSYMSHHIGMSMLSVNNALNGFIMQKRFMRDPIMRAASYLLSEKLPDMIMPYNTQDNLIIPDTSVSRHQNKFIENKSLSLISPKACVIRDGGMNELLLDNGCGFIKYYDKNVTKYRIDYILNPVGVFNFLSINNGEADSLTYAPLYNNTNKYSARFFDNKAVLSCKNSNFSSKITITASEHCICREIRIKNNAPKSKHMSLLLYLEPTLTSHESEISHPLFSGLFMESKFLENEKILLFKRRTREDEEIPMYLAVGISGDYNNIQVETLKENILRRAQGNISLKYFKNADMTGTKSASYIPCCALKIDFELNTQSEKSFKFHITAGNDMDYAISQLRSYKNRISESNALFSTEGEMNLMSRILTALYYSFAIKPINIKPFDISTGIKKLWKYGVSGDTPLIFIYINNKENIQNLNLMLSIFKKIKKTSLSCEMVIGYSERGEYNRPLHSIIRDCITKAELENIVDKKNGIYPINIQNEEDKTFLISAAAYFINSPGPVIENKKHGSFVLSEIKEENTKINDIDNTEHYFKTSVGAFVNDGYIFNEKNSITNRPPWCHILANKTFGTLVSDGSLGFTFARNSRENKLSNWENDVFLDNISEKLYIRIDGEIYDVFKSSQAKFTSYSAEYQCSLANISIKTTVFIPLKLSSKIIMLNIKNESGKNKRIEICYYIDPVLGNSYEKTRRFLNVSESNGSLLIKNAINSDFEKGFAVIDMTGENSFYTNDKSAFLQGIWDSRLADDFEYGICAVKGCTFTLPAGEINKTVMSLSYCQDIKDYDFIKSNVKNIKKVENELKKRKENENYSNKLFINTPDDSLNLIYNNFLMNQIENCRINSRAAFYQCGGAFGFRDQLQDAIGIVTLKPELLRQQIYRCCAHQFEEGDVFHWWHEISENGKKSRGVRTNCSDDLLWLPYAISEYIEITQDTDILNKYIRYKTAPRLEKNEHEKYIFAQASQQKETVYNHAVRAIKYAIKKGKRGMLLYGSGDWNDGMNMVGAKGIGESVWLTMFCALVIKRFIPISEIFNDEKAVAWLKEEYKQLIDAIENHAWDGNWYLRGFYDSGTPLGSHLSDECKIDLLPQSFASILELEDKQRIELGLNSAKEQLVDYENKLIRLFTPAFDTTNENPGYIKGYIPGIRENGGQYTHAAVWLAYGFIKNNDIDTGYDLLKLLNPLNHSHTDDDIKKYMLEPYYFAGDVYDCEERKGRGGWSIYTGSAAWYYKCITEEILGVKRKGKQISFVPNIPTTWGDFEIMMFIENTEISIKYECEQNESNEPIKINLDGKKHKITVKY